MTVKSRLKGKSNIDAEKLNLLVMKIEDEKGGNIDFSEGKLLKENITQFEEYIDGMFNASVDQEAEEGFQTGVWAKEEEGNPELYDETEKFDALVDYLANIGGKATLEGNPDITVELLDNYDIKWSANVTHY